MMTLAWGLRVGAEFRRRVVEIARELGCDPSHLMAVMAFETGRSFSPSIKNPTSSATGLIQFMESTAEGLGTTTAELSEMSAVEQLELVRAYFKPFAGRLNSLSDCYAAVIWPKAVGQDDNFVVFGKGSDAYAHNSALDVDRDNVVTKGECAAFVDKLLTEGLRYENAWAIEPRETAPDEEIDLTDVPQQPEQRMPILALLAAFGPILAQLIPPIAAALDHKSATPAKLDAAGKILEIVTTAAGATNVQQAVEKLQASPELVKTVTDAIVTNPEIQPYLTISGAGVEKARAANTALIAATDKWWKLVLNPVLIVTFATLPLVYIIVLGMVPHIAKVSSDVIAQTIGTVVGLVLGGVLGFWFGQMYTSSNKRVSDNQGVQA